MLQKTPPCWTSSIEIAASAFITSYRPIDETKAALNRELDGGFPHTVKQGSVRAAALAASGLALACVWRL
jgi:hypothetical protein